MKKRCLRFLKLQKFPGMLQEFSKDNMLIPRTSGECNLISNDSQKRQIFCMRYCGFLEIPDNYLKSMRFLTNRKHSY